MLARTHVLFGTAFASAALAVTQEPNLAIATGGLISATAGSITPDIDQPNSRISHKNIIFGGLARVISKPEWGKHRRFWHTPMACAIYSIVFFMILFMLNMIFVNFLGNSISEIFGNTPYLLIFTGYFFLGTLSHLVADSLNIEGVPWISTPPFKKKQRLLPVRYSCRTESGKEVIWRIIAALLTAAFLFLYVKDNANMPDLSNIF